MAQFSILPPSFRVGVLQVDYALALLQQRVAFLQQRRSIGTGLKNVSSDIFGGAHSTKGSGGLTP